MEQTLTYQAYHRNNGFRHLKAIYHRSTGDELVSDPYRLVHHSVMELTLLASVIVLARNERATIEKCLISIEQNSFNRNL